MRYLQFVKCSGGILAGILLLLQACRKTEAGGQPSITIAEDTVYAGKRAAVSALIQLQNVHLIKELKIQLETTPGKFSEYVRIPAAQLSDRYDFRFEIPADKRDVYVFLIVVIDQGGKPIDTKRLYINTQTGLLPVKLTRISRLTGVPLAGEKMANPAPTAQWNIGGTDLGILWDMENGQTGIFFGDTYGNDFKPVGGGPGGAGQWRYNTLGFSTDADLEDGLSIDYMAAEPGNDNFARQIISRSSNGYTAIPSGAIHVKGVDYVHYWDLKSWDGFVTNFASLYQSVDHGRNWTRCTSVYYPGGSKFTCAAYAKKDGYVYIVGTKVLRGALPYLARCREQDMLNQPAYEYWNGTQWILNNEAAATPLFNGAMGEASLTFNRYYKVWMLTYLGDRDLEIRYAHDVSGPWSGPNVLVSTSLYPALYGAFVHPLSTGKEIYFNMSQWVPYNVFFMKAELAFIE